MKIIFWGSDDFARVNLERLIAAGNSIAAVITPSDKAKGRGLKISASDVKICAGEHHIPVLQPEDIRSESFARQLRGFEAEVFVVIAYGKILSGELLAIPRLGALNAHASFLPRYRGAAPINWAILNGEEETGISIIQMNERMDAGEILAQERIKIADEDTAVTLREKLSLLSADCLCRTIEGLSKGRCQAIPQDEKQVTLAPKLTKDMGRISWERSAKHIHDLCRGLLPWPSAYAYYKGKLLKILETEVVDANLTNERPGEIIGKAEKGFIVATKDKGLLIKKVHPESGKAMDAKSFSAGHKVSPGLRLD